MGREQSTSSAHAAIHATPAGYTSAASAASARIAIHATFVAPSLTSSAASRKADPALTPSDPSTVPAPSNLTTLPS